MNCTCPKSRGAKHRQPTAYITRMHNSTVEMTALWPSSSSPSLLTFCLFHLIIALLLLAGRCSASDISAHAAGDGERTVEANESKPN
ncbi:hypothetical protein GUJ93_ZPchr0006g45340 [Zizania palustris]|uniref:Uncharacterized protein n=1 Tax=Zizania palustris TaxID=103762 RepID=A0A8J5T4N8_ZIZPA|nr:hypothetical protein GUJ93_ZPchr0006g45340 [Zizania palustris]